MIKDKAFATRRVAKGGKKDVLAGTRTLVYPQFSDQRSADTRSSNPTKETGTAKEMAAIVKEISVTGIEKFVVARPEEAWRLVVYLARRIQL